MALTPFHRSNLGAGMLDRGDTIEIPDIYMAGLWNFYPDQTSFYTRNGYANRYDGIAVPWSANDPVQFIHFWEDNSQTKRIILAIGGKLYRDDMDGEPPTDITGGLTLSSSQDARYSMFTWDGKVYGTDGINPLFYIASGSANAVRLNTLKSDVPQRAGAGATHRNHIWWGDYTDIAPQKNAVRPYGTIHSEIGDPTFYNAEGGARNDFNRGQKVSRLVEYNNSLYILQNRSIHTARFSPSLGYAQAQTNFFYDQLESDVGLSGAYAIVTTPRGLFFLGERGIYWSPPSVEPQKVKYVGKPVEEFWRNINKARLPYAVGGEIREKNLCIFAVPYGSGRQTNNACIVFNYDSWFQFSNEQDAFHPAFCIWDGEGGGNAMLFNAMGKIIDTDGRHRLLAGSYSGKVWELDEGEQDDGKDFRPRFEFPLIGNPHRETHWHSFILDCDLPKTHLLSAAQTNYDRPLTYYKNITAGSAGAKLDEFVLDVDVLGGDTLGPIRGDLFGESRYTRLRFELLSGAPMAVHALTIFGEPGEAWV